MKLNVRFVVSSPNLTVTFAESVEGATNFFGNSVYNLGEPRMHLLALSSAQIGGNAVLGIPSAGTPADLLSSTYIYEMPPDCRLRRYVNAMRALLIAATDDVTSVTVEGQ
jgi:hypothetical protein